MISPTETAFVLEVLKSCKSELEAMESTYDDYVTAGHLFDQIDEAIELLEGGKYDDKA